MFSGGRQIRSMSVAASMGLIETTEEEKAMCTPALQIICISRQHVSHRSLSDLERNSKKG